MEDVIKYYDDYDEDKRLDRTNFHKLEYLTTIRFLDRFLKPNSKVLDLCAGTGRYSFYLESKGHSVTAVDIVPRFVEIMKKKKAAKASNIEIYLGDARNLEMFEIESFDAVLCMGALYHLKDQDNREKVIEQCTALLKKKGILAVSYINRYALFIKEFNRLNENVERLMLSSIVDSGKSINEVEESFYFSSPKEIEELMRKFNFKKMKNIGTDGIGYMLSDKLSDLTKEEYDLWLDYHFKTCDNENLIGYSIHGLCLGEKQ
jgi:2-polyprenyl-3-methyl-5-hydroxy-6-metoxy-1,4-benzoquinol methylase